MESLCFLVEKIGPYHAARLQRAARDKFGCIIAVELAPQDQTYAWQPLACPPDAGFVRRPLPVARADGLPGRPPDAGSLCRLLDECQPTAVFLNGWADPWALRALSWCMRHRVPAIVMSDSQQRDEPRQAWKEAIKRRFVRRCQAAFVAGQRHQEYVRTLGMSKERIALGYDVVDNDYFEAGANAVRADAVVWKARLGLQEHRAFFLCVSRFVPKKNLPRLVRAFGKYRERHRAARGRDDEGWHLVLLGDGAGRSALEALIAQEGLASQVHLPGFCQYDEMPGYYGLAGALVLASTSDQWGLAVNEALAAGLPVLVSKACGCVPELVQDGINGHSFDPLDVDRLADLLFHIATMEVDEREAAGEAGRCLVARWSLDRFTEGVRQVVGMAKTAPLASRFNLMHVSDRLLFRALAHFRTP